MAGSAANLTSHGIRKMANSITSKELKALLENDPEVVLLDVRRKADYEAAPQTIGSGVWRDPEKVDEWSDEIPRDRPVVAYCVKGGAVSQSVADRLKKIELETPMYDALYAWRQAQVEKV